MEDRNSFDITSKQLVFLLVGAMVGSGILMLPRITAKSVGQDAWLVVLMGAFLPFVSLFFADRLYKKYPGKDFMQLVDFLVGKFIGAVIMLAFAAYSLLAATTILRVFMEAVSAFLLPLTPLTVKLALLLFACAYMAAGSLKVLGRVCELLFYLLLPLFLFILPAVLQHGSLQYLMPPFTHSIGAYLKGSMTTSYVYSGFELYMLYFPFVVRKKEAFKASIIALAITAALYLYMTVLTIAVFGPGLIQYFVWPALRLVATTELPVVERMEFLLLMAWVGVAFRPIANQYFSSSYLLSRMLRLKSHRLIVYVLFPVIIVLAMLPENIYVTFRLSDYIGGASVLIGVVLPMLLYLISLFKTEKRGKRSAKG